MTSEPTTRSGSAGQLWTIDELGAEVALALCVDYASQPNGQVSDIPNRRSIRYYTTLGLIDRPAAMRGRTALYGRRHLLQIVAIKRLQLGGLSLAAVQQKLAVATDEKLAEIALLPAADEEGGKARPAVPVSEPERRNDGPSFWRTEPAPVTTAEPAVAPILPAVRLVEGVTLLIESQRPLDPDDLAAIETAAKPLLKVLRQRGLSGP